MTERAEYAVLRFVDKNGYCHMVSDYVKGSSIAGHIKEHPQMEKQDFFHLLSQITAVALQYSKWQDGDCYGYMNPYAFILAGEELTLLDTKDEENEQAIAFMQRKNVRSLFMRPQRVLSLKMNFEDDMYGLGKTLQFLAAKSEVTPKMGRKEEKILKRIISKCLDEKKKSIKDLKEVNRELRQLEEAGNKRSTGRTVKRAISAVIAGTAILGGIIFLRGDAGQTAYAGTKNADTARVHEADMKNESGESGDTDVSQTVNPEYIEAKMELGLLYFTELEDREQAVACMEELENVSELAKTYLKIFAFLHQERTETYIGRELEQTLESGQEQLKVYQTAAENWEEKQILYEMPFLRAYGILDTGTAAEQSIELCSGLLENNEWKLGQQENDRESEIRICLAGAYEKIGDEERALEEYETVKGLQGDKNTQEQIFVKLAELYDKTGQTEKAWETLEEGTQKVADSEVLWLRYLNKCCADSGIERVACADYVKQALEAIPELTENEEFKKLQKEYEITVEGESICVGK